MDSKQPIEVEINALIKKSAFKQCYSKLKELRTRYPQSSYYEVLELYVKYKHLPNQFDIETLIIDPYGRDKITSQKINNDLRTLDLLFRMLVEMNHYDDALNVMELAHTKFGGWELAYEYFDKCLQCFDYRKMIEASAALCSYNKEFSQTVPKDSRNSGRMFRFWNAIATLAYFRYQSDRVTKQESLILPRLCFERLEKLKPFQNEQETIIYCMVCDELYKENGIDPDIILPGLTKSVDLYLKTFLIKHVKDPQVLFDTCFQLLSKIDDFQLIQKLVEAGHLLGKSIDELTKCIDDTVGDSRNGRLSRFEIDLIYNMRDELGIKITKKSLNHYLTKFHNKPCCAVDITTYRNQIDTAELKQCMESFPNTDVVHDSNLHQLNLVQTGLESSVELYNRHSDSLKQKSKTDYSNNATFIIDIVQNILARNDYGSLYNRLLAINILENYQQRDPQNFQTAPILIQLYMESGFPTLAHLVYKGLKVKNVQVDSMDYLLYTRFGANFPNKQHEMIQLDLIDHLRLYDGINDRLSQFIKISMERQSHSKVLGMVDLKGKLVTSISRWIIMVEQLEMSRLYNDKKQRSNLLSNFHGQWNELIHCNKMMHDSDNLLNLFSDNRDLERVSDSGIFKYWQVDIEWIVCKVIKEFMFESIPNREHNETIQMLLTGLTNPEDGDYVDIVNKNKYMTPSEKWSCIVVSGVYNNKLTDQFDSIKDLLSSDINTWKLCHNYLTILNTLKTLASLKKCQSVKPIIQNQLIYIRDKCDNIFSEYRSKVKDTLTQTKRDPIMERLNYSSINDSMFLDSLLMVQKFVRNL